MIFAYIFLHCYCCCFQNPKIEPSILTEETAEELAEVISPELKPKLSTGQPCNPILKSSSMTIDEAGSSILSQGVSGVTLLSIGEQINDSTTSQHNGAFSREFFLQENILKN